MDALRTVETRWFMKGDLPDSALAWFPTMGEPVFQPPRTDNYLAILSDDVGIKLREGRIEVKPRVADLGNYEFVTGLTGHVQCWAKWGFEIVEDGLLTGEGHKEWVPISKRRWLQFFRFDLDSGLTQMAFSEQDYPPGTLELTGVSFRESERWWTVGIEVVEAGGDGAAALDCLTAITRLVGGSSMVSFLAAGQSISYPGWLMQLLAG